MKLTHAVAVVALGTSIGGALMVGCAAGGSTTGTGETSCQPNTFRECPCTVVSSGTQTCSLDGKSWGACQCPEADAGNDAAFDGPSVCGDGMCTGSESCTTCPADCGVCPACTYAPSCTGADSVPANPTALASFDNAGQATYTSGVGFGDPNGLDVCSYPLLKMRVSQVQIHKNGVSGSLEMFCMVQADDGQSSTLMITPEWMNLSDNNPPLTLAPAAGTFWGETSGADAGGPIGVKLSQFNVTVTYQCFMVLQPDALQKALGAVAQYAGAAAGIPGNPYGWAFGLGGAAAAAAAAAAAVGNGVAQLLNVQQTIDASALLKLTNGYTWKVEQSGSTKAGGDCNVFESCDWDWELDVEAWGCAAPKGQIPQ